MNIIKRPIAREWLYLLGSFFIGFAVLPFVVVIIESIVDGREAIAWGELTEFWETALGMGDGDVAFVWLWIVSPYILCQTIRSTIWAIKTLRHHSAEGRT